MTRKKAIEIVVANVKMGLPPKSLGWMEAAIHETRLQFCEGLSREEPKKFMGTWYLPRTWLEENGYL